jgi:hypothetical protein
VQRRWQRKRPHTHISTCWRVNKHKETSGTQSISTLLLTSSRAYPSSVSFSYLSFLFPDGRPFKVKFHTMVNHSFRLKAYLLVDQKYRYTVSRIFNSDIQGVIESWTDILTTSYCLHVELGKNI